MWVSLHEDRTRGPDETALIVEACRLVDRLDQLDAALRGDAWMDLAESTSGRLVVVVDGAASEARLTAGALKGIVAELRLQRVEGVTRGGAVPTGEVPAPEQEVDEVDELRARRAAPGRGADPAG